MIVRRVLGSRGRQLYRLGPRVVLIREGRGGWRREIKRRRSGLLRWCRRRRDGLRPRRRRLLVCLGEGFSRLELSYWLID